MKPISSIPEYQIFGKTTKKEILQKGKYICSFDLYYLKKLLREVREQDLIEKEHGTFTIITRDLEKKIIYCGFIAIKGKFCPIISSRLDEDLKEIMKRGYSHAFY